MVEFNLGFSDGFCDSLAGGICGEHSDRAVFDGWFLFHHFAGAANRATASGLWLRFLRRLQFFFSGQVDSSGFHVCRG